MSFAPAVKSKSKLRLAIAALSGAGKTYTALRIATGIAATIKTKIALIDSEHGSASKYADRFTFDTVEPYDFSIDTYLKLIEEAATAGYGVLILDSLSHLWHELNAEVERIARAKYRGNTWSAWSEGTPKQRKLIEAILSYPGHVIGTMRVDTEWTQEEDRNGKKRPIKVGMKPVQGKGIEYEFDMLMTLTHDHIASIEKDRTGKFQDQSIDKPTEQFGIELVQWLNDPKAAAPAPAKPAAKAAEPEDFADDGHSPNVDMSQLDAARLAAIDRLAIAARTYEITDDTLQMFVARHNEGITNLNDLTKDQAYDLLPKLEALGRLNKAIIDHQPTPKQLASALKRLGVGHAVELDAADADRLAEGIAKMRQKTAAA